MRGRVKGGVVRTDEPLPEGTEVEVTPLPGSVVSPSGELERHLKSLEERGELERPELPTGGLLQPLVDHPVAGALEQFLEDRR
jgi:hypothetical protein